MVSGMIVIPASLRSDFIHMAGMTIHIALESTIHIVGIRNPPRVAALQSPLRPRAAFSECPMEPSLMAKNGLYSWHGILNRASLVAGPTNSDFVGSCT
jgi:hypothetical protein